MPRVLHAVVRRGRGAVGDFAPCVVAQQAILVTVAKVLDTRFIEDMYQLETIRGVVSVHIAKPVDFGPDHKELPAFRALRTVGPVSKPK